MTAQATTQPRVPRGRQPSFERGIVGDVMSHGVMTARRSSPLRDVAATMADFQVHSVVVTDLELRSGEVRAFGIVSDADVMRAAGDDLDRLTAGECAITELITVTPNETIEHATQLMAEHELTHLLVVDPETGRPAGVISSLDVAAVLARG